MNRREILKAAGSITAVMCIPNIAETSGIKVTEKPPGYIHIEIVGHIDPDPRVVQAAIRQSIDDFQVLLGTR